jgi:hypothetical protein
MKRTFINEKSPTLVGMRPFLLYVIGWIQILDARTVPIWTMNYYPVHFIALFEKNTDKKGRDPEHNY